MRYITGAVGVGLIGLLTGTSLFGYIPGSHERSLVPTSVRAAPGGYRSWSFWHSGSHGGK